jgi:cytochrome c peroxidase
VHRYKMVTLAFSPLLVLLGCDAEVEDGAADTRAPSALAQQDVVAQTQNQSQADLSLIAELGALIFFDERLSAEFNQACTACHGSEVGGAGPDLLSNLSGGIYEGSIHNRFGNRKAPSSSYNVFAPVFTFTDGEFVGGNFWDGRATGWRLGAPAVDQAQGPFLNPLEQALADGAVVVERVCLPPYGFMFRWIWGENACLDADLGYAAVAHSIAVFETSSRSSPFRSKYDAYLAGEETLSPIEADGLALFTGAARCTNCHVLDVPPGVPGPLFTDFTYENIGVPRNIANPFYRMSEVYVDGEAVNPLGFGWVDPGLGGFLEQLADDDHWRTQPYVPESVLDLSTAELTEYAQSSLGKHKVPTLRNVARRPFPSFVKAYTHNGYFKTLEGLVHFYNTRDVLPLCPGDFTEAEALALDCWPQPEAPKSVNHEDVGDLGLSQADETALVAFLETLSDS